MLTHEEMIGIQAEKHELVPIDLFYSVEEFVLHRIHSAAYYYLAEFCEDKEILDLGCNVGYGSFILSQSAKAVTGVDVSDNAIEVAKKYYNEIENIHFKLVDGKTLPFEDNSFDVVVTCQVIEHIVDCDEYINEIKRVLKTDGFVAFTTPNGGIRLDPGMKPWNVFHVREFQPNELFHTLREYFLSVEIHGMYAEEPIDSVERKRLDYAKKRARNSSMQEQLTERGGMLATIKGYIPNNLKNHIKQVIKKINPEDDNVREPLANSILAKYEVAKIYYRQKDISDALDLLAICRNK